MSPQAGKAGKEASSISAMYARSVQILRSDAKGVK